MFNTKLNALNYEFSKDFNYEDSKQFQQIIGWIEDQKIRHYKIEERYGLRDVNSSQWENAFRTYLSDIECPFDGNQKQLVLDWILNLALRLEYEDNLKVYQNLKVEDIKREPRIVRNNPIDNLDFDCIQFKEGVKQLAQMVKVPNHPNNHLITLRAIYLLIRNKYCNEFEDKNFNEKNDKIITKKVEDNSIALKVGNDYVLNNCAKILRLLYIQDLRQLQTNINETIAAVQSITANPKTDTTLGKVGI